MKSTRESDIGKVEVGDKVSNESIADALGVIFRV